MLPTGVWHSLIGFKQGVRAIYLQSTEFIMACLSNMNKSVLFIIRLKAVL